jgi:hypothetical protein
MFMAVLSSLNRSIVLRFLKDERRLRASQHLCDTIFVGGQPLMDVIAALQDEATKLKKQLDTVLHAMHLLGKGKSKKAPIKRRRISAAGKARIAAAQKKRWAKVRAAKKKAA